MGRSAELREQRERELDTRRALTRARRIVAMCVFLTVIAVAAAVFGYVSTQRARRAEQQAQSARATAEHARGEAEHLLGYLTDDLTLESEGVGRVQVVADLAKQEVDYYQSLPEELVHEHGEKTPGFSRFIADCDWTFLRASTALTNGDFDAAKKIAQAFSIEPALDESKDEQRQFRGYCRHHRGVMAGAHSDGRTGRRCGGGKRLAGRLPRRHGLDEIDEGS